MSYQDIDYLLQSKPWIKPVYDKEAAVNYFQYVRSASQVTIQSHMQLIRRSRHNSLRGNDQWVSYDSVDTIKEKVDFANSMG